MITVDEQKDLLPKIQSKKSTIVGIGASAGGLQALRIFFESLPDDTGMAFVVIVHLAPNRKSALPNILQQYTSMPVNQVQERIRVEPNHVYVIPPGWRTLMTGTDLELRAFEEPRGRRTPVDDFFRSLATYSHNVVAIILSGSGADGAVGVKAVKEKDGLLLIQDPDEAEFDGMPLAAIDTGLADVILPVSKLAEKLLSYHQSGYPLRGGPRQLNEHERTQLNNIISEVEEQTSHSFNHYRHEALLLRIARRMRLHGSKALDDYLSLLRQTPNEAPTLFNDLLVGVTTFFRNPESWQVLAKKVIPELFSTKNRNGRIRIWSIGCATGEEAYSLAILLMEEIDRRQADIPENEHRINMPKIQIFATDLEEATLRRAREGIYPEVIEADLSQERLERFFVKEGLYYRVRDELRQMVIFTNHSVLYDPPFSQLDIISSRNLLIHLQPPLRRTVLEIFFFSLNQGGYLFLDKPDSIEVSSDLFRTLSNKHFIYSTRAKQGKNFPIPKPPILLDGVNSDQDLSAAQTKQNPFQDSTAKRLIPNTNLTLEQRHQQALKALGPPSLLVNENYRILHLSESAGRYLQPRLGPMTPDLLRLIRPELQSELQTSLNQVFQTQRTILTPVIHVPFNGIFHRVILSIHPFKEDVDPQAESLALIFFLEEGPELEGVGSNVEPAENRAEANQVRRLEGEVAHLHEQLQTTIVRYEVTNEELRVANEELQSINEEFKATVEELETSQEELRSVNDELNISNYELDRRLEQISRTHSDLENLIAATDIATLFLNRDLHIQRFTPAATKLFPLQQSDIGRHISHLTHQLAYDRVVEEAREVLRTGSSSNSEIQDNTGRWLLMRLRPYIDLDASINGVVLTFVDINEVKQTEASLRKSEVRLAREVDALRRLHQMIGRVVTISNMELALDEILNAAVDILEADFGNIQLLDHKRQILTIVADRGFKQSFLERFHEVDTDDNTACGQALRSGRRVFIEDIGVDPAYVPYLEVAREAGYEAVQSTPLINHQGQILGMLSTHYRRPTSLSARDERLLDLFAFHAANLIERLRAEERLEERVEKRTAQVRQLVSELIISEQTVRQRLAQSLHDDLQQTLYAVKIQLQFLSDDLDGQEEVDRLIKATNYALDLTRQLTVELSPPVLEKEGLLAALEWLAGHMFDIYGLHVAVGSEDGPEVVTKEQSILLYQIVRELLFNVVKHAGVKKALITLQKEDGGFSITVSDHGLGFDMTAEQTESINSFGLHSIKERLQLIDGYTDIDSQPGQGTRIRLFIPSSRSDTQTLQNQ